MRAFLAPLAAILIATSMPAQAATAYLVGPCTPGTSVTGMLIYTGVYQYGSQRFTRSFTSLCPLSIEVF